MDYRERGFYARGVYLRQDTSRMGTARVSKMEAICPEDITLMLQGDNKIIKLTYSS